MTATEDPNISWVTLDSLRYDRTSPCAGGLDVTPDLRSLAESDGSTSYRHGITHGIDTAASTASIMTGTYPDYHGVNVGDGTGTIPDRLDTVAERLSNSGYRTACLTRNPRLELIGADRGFDRFTELSYSMLLRPSM